MARRRSLETTMAGGCWVSSIDRQTTSAPHSALAPRFSNALITNSSPVTLRKKRYGCLDQLLIRSLQPNRKNNLSHSPQAVITSCAMAGLLTRITCCSIVDLMAQTTAATHTQTHSRSSWPSTEEHS